ncbi:MAG: hypothetical protein F8N36_13670 [Desulfovibrio sp.]|uniref:hypothetical protein n=1 Tax=Desulfovibrio sp. TaxID=885 RepID=UPI00135D9743|nr:hypothetical protein [Desulfovibrio sp.]MTJ93888.1 hypothetical protein [Desulfovibrio sp.]
MPAFFLPAASDPEQAENAYSAIRQFVASQISGPLEDRRIFRLDYVHSGKHRIAQVGERESHEGAPVIAIFKQQNYPLYFVCTPDRGVVRGGPILVGENEVHSRIDFSEE